MLKERIAFINKILETCHIMLNDSTQDAESKVYWLDTKNKYEAKLALIEGEAAK